MTSRRSSLKAGLPRGIAKHTPPSASKKSSAPVPERNVDLMGVHNTETTPQGPSSKTTQDSPKQNSSASPFVPKPPTDLESTSLTDLTGPEQHDTEDSMEVDDEYDNATTRRPRRSIKRRSYVEDSEDLGPVKTDDDEDVDVFQGSSASSVSTAPTTDLELTPSDSDGDGYGDSSDEGSRAPKRRKISGKAHIAGTLIISNILIAKSKLQDGRDISDADAMIIDDMSEPDLPALSTDAMPNKPKARQLNKDTFGGGKGGWVMGIKEHLAPMHENADIMADMTSKARKLGLEQVIKHLAGRPLRIGTMCSGTESPILALMCYQDCGYPPTPLPRFIS